MSASVYAANLAKLTKATKCSKISKLAKLPENAMTTILAAIASTAVPACKESRSANNGLGVNVDVRDVVSVEIDMPIVQPEQVVSNKCVKSGVEQERYNNAKQLGRLASPDTPIGADVVLFGGDIIAKSTAEGYISRHGGSHDTILADCPAGDIVVHCAIRVVAKQLSADPVRPIIETADSVCVGIASVGDSVECRAVDGDVGFVVFEMDAQSVGNQSEDNVDSFRYRRKKVTVPPEVRTYFLEYSDYQKQN